MMKKSLAERISISRPSPGSVALFYTGQAGFILRTPMMSTVGVDLYLSDFLEGNDGSYKRLIPAVLEPEDFKADLLVSTHAHEDHLDQGLLDVTASALPEMRYLGAPDCRAMYAQKGISEDKTIILSKGERVSMMGMEFRGIYADHGELAPDAMGVLVSVAGLNIYFTGDTSCCPDRLAASLGDAPVDIMVVPINPAYGNPGEEGAAKIAAAIRPRLAIAAHFGMFVEHGGVPGEFLKHAARLLEGTETRAIAMAPGERLLFSARDGVLDLETETEAKRRMFHD